jgi:hypothetical protein
MKLVTFWGSYFFNSTARAKFPSNLGLSGTESIRFQGRGNNSVAGTLNGLVTRTCSVRCILWLS